MTNFADRKNLSFSIFKSAMTHYKTARVGITDIYYAISYWYLDPYVSAPNYGNLFQFISRYSLSYHACYLYKGKHLGSFATQLVFTICKLLVLRHLHHKRTDSMKLSVFNTRDSP